MRRQIAQVVELRCLGSGNAQKFRQDLKRPELAQILYVSLNKRVHIGAIPICRPPDCRSPNCSRIASCDNGLDQFPAQALSGMDRKVGVE